MRFSIRAGAVALALIFAPAGAAFAQQAQIYTGWFGNVAVGGYDSVAYFTAGKPVKGDARFRTTWRGAEFRFASTANLTAFRADPARYAPQFGGYCAWAVSQGYTAAGDPKVWKIVGGKLYLNYNAEAARLWSRDIPGNIAAGNRNWPGVLKA